MGIDLFEYMAYLQNKVNRQNAEKSADFQKRMEEYETKQAAEQARRQMNIDAAAKADAAETAKRRAEWEYYKRKEEEKRKR